MIYTGDGHRVARLLDHMTRVEAEAADLIVAEYSSDLECDALTDGEVKLVAPIQALIDGFGLGEALAESAEQTARTW